MTTGRRGSRRAICRALTFAYFSALFGAVARPGTEDDSHYYSLTNSHSLTKSSTRIAVGFRASPSDTALLRFRDRHSVLDPGFAPRPYAREFAVFGTCEVDFPQAAAALEADPDVRRVLPVYYPSHSTGEDSYFLVTDEVSVAFDPRLPQDSVTGILRNFGLTVRDVNPHYPNTILCALADTSRSTPVTVGNELHDLPGVQWASANFASRIESHSTPSDPYFANQFYLRQIEADKAWDICSTKVDTAVRVAVIDQGVAAHPDLPASRLIRGWDAAGYSVKNGVPDTDATPGQWSSHGECVAGIIGASRNGTGVVGVDPWCHIVPFKIYYDVEYSDMVHTRWWVARAIDSAAHSGAAVISCSWGLNPGDTTAEIQAAIIHAVDETTAVRPYGCVMFFSVGNQGGPVRFPATLEQVIAIGAVDSNDAVCAYTNRGPEVDLAAPSSATMNICDEHFYAMDQAGSLGRNPVHDGCGGVWSDIPNLDYTRDFGGTSAACPQAAGVAALLLGRRPDLVRYNWNYTLVSTTADTIKNILYNTAEDVGPQGNDWFTGWGRINAYRALLSVSHGDVILDGKYDVKDVVGAVEVIFRGGALPWYEGAMDMNCDEVWNIQDVCLLIDVVFRGGLPPAPCYRYLQYYP